MHKPILSLLGRCSLLVVVLAGCTRAPSVPGAVGLTESDRIELVADRAEPITEIRVAEGDAVEAGQVLLVLDSARVDQRVALTQALMSLARAYSDELVEGPRAETIEAQRARLAGADREVAFRQTELARLSVLLERGLSSVEARDQARAALDAAAAEQRAAAALLAELEAGSRRERIAQAGAAIRAADAAIRSQEIERERLTVRAPAAGIVDSLPFELGEQPPAGSVVAVLLTGPQAHARIYLPERWRVGVAPGTPARVWVDGLEQELDGRVRRIEAEATFTPYFALTERDRGRLSYIAEVEIEHPDRRLPDGVPVTVTFPGI